MTTGTFVNEIQAGIEWLDENAPENWRELIDLDGLMMVDARYCVLGQVFGEGMGPIYGYDHALAQFAVNEDDFEEMGFHDSAGRYSTLTREWREALA